jgi:hypothetical protein
VSSTTAAARLFNSAALSPYSKSLPGDEQREDFLKLSADYGVGAGVVVVPVLIPDAGVDIGVDVVVLELDDDEVPPAGDGFMIVVLFSVFSAGDAVVVVGWTSVLCSQPPRSAALARMQIIFFICKMGCPCVGQT